MEQAFTHKTLNSNTLEITHTLTEQKISHTAN